MLSVIVAATAMAAVVALTLPVTPALAPSARAAPRWVAALAAVPAGLFALSTPLVAVLAVIAMGLLAAGWLLWHRRRSRLRARQVAGRVLETCELLAAELDSGQPPGRSLVRGAESWPPLRPAAEAHDLGGDVPAALRRLSTMPGAADLRLLAAAWAVSSRSGQGLADSVRRCAAGLRGAHRARQIVEGELASARATARLVAALPVLALLMGSGAGGRPLAFLFGHPAGLACLAGGLIFGFAGLWWIEVIAGEVEEGP
jgi:tight adherence protein B